MSNVTLDVSTEEIFSVRTFHKTRAFIDADGGFTHARTGVYPLYAIFPSPRKVCFFIIRNGVIKYIRGVDMRARAAFSDEIFTFEFVRNESVGSIAIRQSGEYWSSRLKPSRVCLNPDNLTWERFFLDKINSIEFAPVEAVLVLHSEYDIKPALARVNRQNVNIAAIFFSDPFGDGELVPPKLNIPLRSFGALDNFLRDGREYCWMSGGFFEPRQITEYLESRGIPRGSIVDIKTKSVCYKTWRKNFKAAIETVTKFILLGESFYIGEIDLERIVNRRGADLTDNDQDIRQSYYIARHVLERNSSVEFVMLSLAPESLFESGTRGNYIFAEPDHSIGDKVLGSLLNDALADSDEEETDDAAETEETPPDKNLAYQVDLWRDDKPPSIDNLDRNLETLERFIEMCLERGVKPVVLILPRSPETNTPDASMRLLRRTLRYYERLYDFNVIDLTELPLGYEHFERPTWLNSKGATAIGRVLNWKLRRLGLLPVEDMRQMTYAELEVLRSLLSADEYNEMMSRIFESKVESLRRKDKIKVGFVGFDSSMWCGDELYHAFEQSERYEPTIFLNLRADQSHALILPVFEKSIELFRSRGMNVVSIKDHDARIPTQDVLIYLTPYFTHLRRTFRPERMTAETLVTYIPYGFRTTSWGIAHFGIHFIAWKLFADSQTWVRLLENAHAVAVERLVYSGLPKMDSTFRAEPSKFEWKEAQPGSTKIIWAPHWSLKGFKNLRLGTFNHNYKFMYEYAAAHPETSWVFKPHPNLAYAVVDTKLFPSTAAFKEYIDKWEALPNAKVSAVGYYQDIFESSDGMILDSGSFIAEYQYAHKPMLFLMRETTTFSALGKAIVDANYSVDGKDFDGITRFIEDVLINKHDTQSEAREKIFDAELNYVKHNGMLASEKIFRTIDDAVSSSEPTVDNALALEPSVKSVNVIAPRDNESFVRNLYVDEIRNGCFVRSQLKKLWNEQIKIILEVDRICQKHGIHYFAHAGTMLGAVRHGGFVPWDDDVDLVMLRPDFERFLKVAPKELGSRFFLDAYYNYALADEPPLKSGERLTALSRQLTQFLTARRWWPIVNYLKLRSNDTTMIQWPRRKHFHQGVWIDIFPFESLPDFGDESQRRHFAEGVELLMAVTNVAALKNILSENENFVLPREETLRILKLPFKERALIYEAHMGKAMHETERVANIFMLQNNAYFTFKREVVSDTIRMPFEGITVPVPQRYDETLASMYGDWREPVPQPPHTQTYSTDISYKHYFELVK